MKTNESTIDRAIRIIAGLGLLAITQVGPQTPWGYAGAILVVTGIWGFCPLYRLAGISTCAVK